MLRKLVLASGLVFGLGLGQGAPAWAAGAYTVDAVHSTVLFRVKHMNTSFSYGRFNDISGKFAFGEKDPTQSSFDFEVKVASIDTANAGRDKHLKGPDFFNAAQFSTIKFKSKSVTSAGDPDAYQVAGDLTLHGVTKPISIKIVKTGTGKDMRGKAVAGFESHFSIKRSDYKMGNMVGPIGDDVSVTVSVEGAQ